MSSANLASGRQFRGRMARTILAISVPVSLLPLVAVGSVVYRYASGFMGRLPENVLISWAALIGMSLLLAWLIIWLTARRLTRPFLELADTMHSFLKGNWELRAQIHQQDETGLLADLFNQLANDMAETRRLMEKRTAEPDSDRRQAVAQLSQVATYSISLDELIDQAIKLSLRYLGCTFAAVYLLEKIEGQKFAVLQQSTGSPEFEGTLLAQRFKEKKILIAPDPTSEWLAGKAIESKHPQISATKVVPGIYEAVIPITLSSQVVGVFDLFAANLNAESRLGPFNARVMAELQVMANVLALAAARSAQPGFNPTQAAADEMSQELQLPSLRQLGLETEKASSASFSIHARSTEQVVAETAKILKQSPYVSAILLPEGEGMRVAFHWTEKNQPAGQSFPDYISISMETFKPFYLPPDAPEEFPAEPQPILVADLGKSRLPNELLDLPRQMGCSSAAFLPALSNRTLVALLVLGIPSQHLGKKDNASTPPLTLDNLIIYMDVLEKMVADLERLPPQGAAQRNQAELQTLWNVSQSISQETKLASLYQVIHQQVVAAMGEVSTFAVALYDFETKLICIPYLYEEGQLINLDPFSLGEGLISVVIRSGKPLLLVEDVDIQLTQLGAEIMGVSPKSWLGVPIILGSEVLGVMIAQDLYQEFRFNEDDQRLLSTLATQVGILIRNAQLVESSQKEIQKEILINEITAKIRRSPDIRSILKTTADELGKVLGASRAHIEIQTKDIAPNGEHSSSLSQVNPAFAEGTFASNGSNGNGAGQREGEQFQEGEG